MAYSDLVLAEASLESYHKLAETSGTTAVDSSGNAHDATYPSGVTLGQTGLLLSDPDTAVLWGATSDVTARLDLGYATNFTAFTFEFAVYTTGPAQTGTILSKRSFYATSFTDFPIKITLSTAGMLSVSLSAGDDFNMDLTLTAPLSLSESHHVAVCVTNNGAVEIWVDGGLAASTIITFALSTNARNWCIGAPSFSNLGGVDTEYLTNTTLEKCALYSSHLSASTVKAHAFAALGVTAGQSVPLTLTGLPGHAAQSIPIALAGHIDTTAQSIPVLLDGVPGYAAQTIQLSLIGHLDTATQAIPIALAGYLAQSAQAVPAALAGHVDTASQSLPLRLLGLTPTAAQSVPLTLTAVAESAVAGPAVRWGLAVSLGGSDISARLSGPMQIGVRENESGTARLSFLPAAGAIVPEQYENQRLLVDWLLLDGSGAEQARFRRFTGVVELAEYDPDAGQVQLSATNDLQGGVEVLDRTTIATRVGGQWTRHVFDDTADGWQYAKDRLSTQQAEFHISRHGALVVVPWAAKSTADITITDDGRFADTVRLRRATRRELVTSYTINLDFRFTRLRHREVGFKLVDIDFCSYLRNSFELPAKGMVQGAASGGGWTQIGDISFTELPGSGTYCSGRNWLNTDTDDDFCLGASWKAARRWAQTVTEQYTLEVTAPDLAESVGDQVTSADYGIEAVYDAAEYERNTDFSGPPVSAALDPALQDYVQEATDAEQTGRTAMEAAQQCALAVARSEILGRARRNRLSLGCVYRPDMDLAKTIRVQGAYLTAQGKLAAIDETLDPVTGALSMTITLALSRHGGSGTASDSPLNPSSRPDVTSETPTARIHALGLRLGQTAGSPADTGEVDGYFANVPSNGDDYDATGPTYQRRLTVNYPEIEAAARQAVAAPITTAYTVAVPEDTLIMEA